MTDRLSEEERAHGPPPEFDEPISLPRTGLGWMPLLLALLLAAALVVFLYSLLS